MQGESDAILSTKKDCYKKKLKMLASALKEDMNIERFGVIRVGAFANDKRDDEIISAQDEVCKEDPLFLMLTDIAVDLNKEALMMNPHVAGHYSAAGLEKLGAVAGASFGKAVI